jgi:hypothetical protein
VRWLRDLVWFVRLLSLGLVRLAARTLGIVVGLPLRVLGRAVIAAARAGRRTWLGWGPWRRWAIAVCAASAILAAGLWGGAVAFAAFSAEYGFHPDVNGQAWRDLAPRYATVADCVSCHDPEYVKLTSATHAGIGCESCHGPLAAHAADATSAQAAGHPVTFSVTKPTDVVCRDCHVSAVGRPAGFREIVVDDHYLPLCLQCHDPHTAISRRPPVVGHTLEHIPDCITCHGAEGFKKRDVWHPVTSSDDGTCLLCHLPDRGPDTGDGATGSIAYPLARMLARTDG